jgi:hypothetical protein
MSGPERASGRFLLYVPPLYLVKPLGEGLFVRVEAPVLDDPPGPALARSLDRITAGGRDLE